MRAGHRVIRMHGAAQLIHFLVVVDRGAHDHESMRDDGCRCGVNAAEALVFDLLALADDGGAAVAEIRARLSRLRIQRDQPPVRGVEIDARRASRIRERLVIPPKRNAAADVVVRIADVGIELGIEAP